MRIFFWRSKTSGDYLSHKSGISEETAQQLRELKAGDRLILYTEQKDSMSSPDLVLKIYKEKKTTEWSLE